MAQETLKLVITADTQEAINDIQQFANKMQGVKTKLGEMASQTAQATQTLGNFSRVAQDAPYGIMGMANNINPLVESFQRLKETTGSTTGAIQAMIAGLTGPAGIGLAIGVVTSLLVTFGKDIANFFKGAASQVDELKKSLAEINKELFKIAGSAQANLSTGKVLAGIIGDDKQTMERRKNALAELKILYKDSEQIKKLEVTSNKEYLNTIINQAAMQQFAIKSQENNQQKLTTLYDQRKKDEANQKAELSNIKGSIYSVAGPGGRASEITVEQQIATVNKKYDKIFAAQDILIKKAEEKNAEMVNAIVNFGRPGKEKAPKTDNTVMDNLQREIQSIIRDYNALPHPKHQELVVERESLVNKQADSVAKKKLTTDGMAWAQQEMYDLTKAQNQEQETFNNNLNLTKDIVGNLAPAFESVFSAMIMGEDVGKALEASFKQIVIQLISMVTQALLFKAILGALTGGTSAFGEAAAGAVGFGGGFGGFMGEFLLRGSDLVLATQRANTNLSYRR